MKSILMMLYTDGSSARNALQTLPAVFGTYGARDRLIISDSLK
jgi:hypothetical protein